jgi:hypothetical protein
MAVGDEDGVAVAAADWLRFVWRDMPVRAATSARRT